MNRLNLKRANELNDYLAHVEALLIKVQMINNPHTVSVNEKHACSYSIDVISLDGYDDARRKFCEDMHSAIIDFLNKEKEIIFNEFETL